MPPRNAYAWVACSLVALAPLPFSLYFTSYLHPKETLILTGVAALALIAAADRRVPLPRLLPYAPFWLWLLLFAAIGLASAPAPMLTFAAAIRGAGVLLAAGMVATLWAQPRARDALMVSLLAGGTLIAVLAWLQYYDLVLGLLPKFPGYDQQVYSVFGNQNYLGGYLAIVLPIGVWRVCRSRDADDAALQARTELAVTWLMIAIVASGLALSGARSAWAAGALGSVVALTAARPTLRTLVPLALMAGSIVFLLVVLAPEQTWERVLRTGQDYDTGGNLRLWFWAGSWHMAQSAPWLGVGLGNYQIASPFHMNAVLLRDGTDAYAWNHLLVDHAHSEPLELLCETGWVGAGILFLALPRMFWLHPAAWGSVLSFAVYASVNPALSTMPHALAAAVLWGMSRRTAEAAPARRTRAHDTVWLVTALVALGLLVAHANATLLPSYAASPYGQLLTR